MSSSFYFGHESKVGDFGPVTVSQLSLSHRVVVVVVIGENRRKILSMFTALNHL